MSALMTRTGERQGDLAAGLGQSQAQVSRKQSGKSHWSLEDVDLLAAHYGLHALDLLAGPTHAVGVLHSAVPSLQAGAQALAVPLPARAQSATAPVTEVPAPEPPAPEPPAPEPLAPEPLAPEPPAREPLAPDFPSPAPEQVPVPASAEPMNAPQQPCVLCGQPASLELDGFPQHLTAEECAAAVAAPSGTVSPPVDKTVPVTAPATPDSTPLVEPTVHAPARPVRSAPGYASTTLVEQITDRAHDVLAACSGDVDAAQAELIKAAIPDVMALLKASRVGGRYEHSEFPPTADILRKKSQKGADDIWEGRPKWRNPELFAAAKKGERIEVTALDMNAAYLSALKCWLPIGQLREDTSGVHDPKKAGVHLITPPDWHHDDLPSPLGARMEPGELWVTESTLRLLLDCARQGLADAPLIHRSLVSGASEALLEKLRRALAETRKTALANDDELTVAYVKAMYSKFVSTIGESSANREIRRPDWMHIIRSKAFTNLWMKAHKAHKAGLQVVEISGTDELHIAGDWRTVFPEGRELNQVKEKQTYILGGKR
ncbi:acyltransferase [Streptomyces sp. NPDC046374]|uniref:acyltransferase n=1 Tax=Streptomyces sp. NPDC046374 TaxID=3154917 RepID=UPI0033D36795